MHLITYEYMNLWVHDDEFSSFELSESDYCCRHDLSSTAGQHIGD